MTRFTSAFAAALIASASFAGVALAEDGEYYEGVSPNHQTQSIHRLQSGSYGYTGSVVRGHDSARWTASVEAPDHGDYYQGANRPN